MKKCIYQKLDGYKYRNYPLDKDGNPCDWAEYETPFRPDVLLATPTKDERGVALDPMIYLNPDGRLLIKKGYAWDGASGPTWDSPCTMRGSLIHDALYQLMRAGLLSQSSRPMADKVLEDVCREDGMWALRAKTWFAAVRLAGSFGAKLGPEKQLRVYTAP